ncbi:hypothetical protein WG66_014853 [Moniliophthora roreri]|uniref:Uncharacterized protein n=1 Tax=Moniliophthora roreri TaxID=221103 RepID=A0A0W0FEK0_MONRR|nr:hypothetical protein WG66_014853 [Moniliophthora roreri]
MADRWSQSGHHFDAKWQRREAFSSLLPGSATYSDPRLYPCEPSYPVDGTGSTRSPPFERVVGSNVVYRNMNSPEIRSRTNPSTVGSVYEQTLLNGSGVASSGCISSSGSYVPTHTTPTSPYHISWPNANTQPSESVTYGGRSPRVLHVYDATVPLDPTVMTSTESGSWYHNASPPSTDDSSDSVPTPGSTTHVYKEVVAPESVVDASMRRRKPESATKIYQCTGFGTCSSTFTTSYNLQSNPSTCISRGAS